MMRDEQARSIGRILREGLESEPSGRQEEACRTAVFEAMDRLSRRAKRPFALIVGSAAAASVIIGIAVAFSLSSHVEKGFGYRIGSSGLRTETGWVSNDGDKTLPIVFENGSRFLLDRKSSAKVVEADSRRVRIDLNKGAVAAAVHGNGKTEWIVEAGPYRVKVLGTEFQVGWDADKERLDVRVSTGHVSVSGASLGDEGVVLSKGNRLVSDRLGAQISTQFAIAKTDDTAPSQGKIDVPGTLLESGPPNDESIDSKAAAGEPLTRGAGTKDALSHRIQPLSKPPWRASADAGDFSGAILAMDEDVAAHAASEADADMLWRLAEEARRMRRTDLSCTFFEALRERAPGSERAAAAAFLLGKTAWDTRRDAKVAKKWLDLYLEESPNGALAEEARGRMMEALISLGNQSEAKRVAKDYLARYPNGSFALHAKKIAERAD